MAGNAKQYGLVIPKKGNQRLLPLPPAVFDEGSASPPPEGDWYKKAMKKEAEKSIVKKQTQLDMQKALEEDPTVFQYDEVYDKIEEKKAEEKAAKKSMEKKPRYIQSLLKQAERRKREQERRNERLIQKEREAEGEEFKDKEAFVTSAYREKLEEFRKQDEEEKRQDYIDNLTDVTKQKDLSGFYRHFFKQTVTGEEVPGETKIKVEEPDKEPVATADQQKSTETKSSEPDKKARQYRKRKASSSESETEQPSNKRLSSPDQDIPLMKSPNTKETQEKSKNKTEQNNENIDADTASSSSSDSSSESEEEEEEEKIKKKKLEENVVIASGSEEGEIKEIEVGNEAAVKEKTEEEGNEGGAKKVKKEETEKEQEAEKVNIWAKRTVGSVFIAALQRYYQRKATKLASSSG